MLNINSWAFLWFYENHFVFDVKTIYKKATIFLEDRIIAVDIHSWSLWFHYGCNDWWLGCAGAQQSRPHEHVSEIWLMGYQHHVWLVQSKHFLWPPDTYYTLTLRCKSVHVYLRPDADIYCKHLKRTTGISTSANMIGIGIVLKIVSYIE